MRRRILWFTAAAGIASVVIAGAIWTLGTTPRSGVAGAPDSIAHPASATSSTGVCGFSGSLVSKITADRPSDQNAATLRSWEAGGDGQLGALAVAGDDVILDRDLQDGTSVFLRFDRNGVPKGSTKIAAKHEGRWTLSDDGTIFLIDSNSGNGRDISRYSLDGAARGSFALPEGKESTGHQLDLQYIVWVPDYKGGPALLVGEGARTVHAVRPDGTYLGVVDGAPDHISNSLGGARIAGVSTAAADDPAAVRSLTVKDLDTGATSLAAVYQDSDSTATGSSTPAPYQLNSVVAGPGGDGFLLSGAHGIQWVDAMGIRKGVWIAGQDGVSPSSPASLMERDGVYWAMVDIAGTTSIATLTSDEMRVRLESPVLLTAELDGDLAQLGLGLGAVTGQPFNHFESGQTPAVWLRAEHGWGAASPTPRPDLAVRYTVTGDPTLADPVRQDEKTVVIPWGGGQSALELPPTRPGAYEVSLAVVNVSDGSVLSGSCLRYSVGSSDAGNDLASTTPGDDWGGPGPLRGVELAANLGIGSHRVQVDFGGLVPDPAAAPDPSKLNRAYVPGSGLSDDPDNDPFQNLREASTFASAHGVHLIIQLANGADAEKTAIASGTWPGWVKIIVAEFAAQVPDITMWEPYNEPNNTYDSAEWYWKTVEIPFADAAHAARAETYVIGGNTLGFADDWWSQAAASGVCDHIDAIGVHPYTGWNRSWEEEGFPEKGQGFDALRTAAGPGCAHLPIWDTESGWTADGAMAYWNQGSNVARKLLWYRSEGIAGWTYFFSEGGWGENGLSWSLIQYRSYVKPGGLAFANVSHLLSGRGTPTEVDLGIPFTHAMSVPGDDTMLVAWTDEARIDATLTTDASNVTITDQYGAVATAALKGGVATVTLTATPQFFRASAGSSLALATPERFGDDLLRGQPVDASSTFKESDPQVITSGTADPYRPWRSGTVEGKLDDSPTVTVSLAQPTAIDRIAVATGNIACCEAGLRHYTVSAQTADGEWHVIAEPDEQFWERTALFRFEPITAVAVRVQVPWTMIRGTKVLDVNYTGFAGGLPPPFMGLQTSTDYVASISAISAWAPVTSP